MMTTVGGVLYLAFYGGDYLVQLSPKYQEMRTKLGELDRAEEHRQQLVERLDAIEKEFARLAGRGETLSGDAGANDYETPASKPAH
jgi:hypothetical protein